MAVEGGVATPQSLFGRRFREKLSLWQRLFQMNWNLFKASRIGVIGLAIMIAFLLLAVAAPFMGLRDPIRWTAPDQDLISVDRFWEQGTWLGGSVLVNSPPITVGASYRVTPIDFDARADRVYLPAGERLYALLARKPDGGASAWGGTAHVNVSRIDGVPRTITLAPVVMNYGFFARAPPDFELYLATDDGKLVIVRDMGDRLPIPEAPVSLSDRITGLAAFNHDLLGVPNVIGRANYITFNGTGSILAGEDWDYRQIPGSQEGDEGEFTSLALNTTGPTVQPLLAYYDVTKGLPKVAEWDGARWPFVSSGGEGIEPFNSDPSVNLGFYTSMAVGSDGYPRVAYYDQTATERNLKYARWDGNSWNRTYVDVAGDVGQYASLALNATDGVHIAYYDAAGRLIYVHGNGTAGAWSFEFADASAGSDVGRFASLALDALGNPHIAYYDATARALKYASKVGPVWTNETVETGDVGEHASLAIDPMAGEPAIAYFDAARGALRFARHAGALWIPEEVDDAGPATVGLYASLAFDPVSGNPAIAYQDETNLDLKYADLAGLAWRNTTLVSEAHVGFNNSLRFDALGHPHIGFYSYSTGRSLEDLVVAGTASGRVYAVDVSIPGDIERQDRSKIITRWDYRIRWNVTVGSEVHLAAGPLRKNGAIPTTSPAFNSAGDAVYLGTLDGRLIALNTSDGGNFWWNATQPFIPMGAPWHTAPVVYSAAEGPPKGSDLVYATTNFVDWNGDATNESLLLVRYANNTLALDQWLLEYTGYGGSAFIGRTLVDSDGGDLTQPVVDGDSIFFGSTSGRLYAIRRDGVGEYPSWDVAPASIRWIYEDPTLLGFEPKFTSPPVVVSERVVLLAASNHNNGTAADTSDDVGVLYSLRTDQGNVSWKRTMPSIIPGMPVSWTAPNPGALHPSVWATYGGAAGRPSGIISLSTVGKFLAPSPPSWANTYECIVDGEPQTCSGYPSGNQYWLGLDSQGRDIFSQVIWGSRIALLVGFLSAFFTVLLGVVVGLIAGYVGGKVEAVLMRFTDVILVLPGLPLIITLAAVLGASIWNIILVISLLGWPGIARIIRAEVLSLKERPFIDSARVTGASTTRIVFRHIAPNVMPLAFLYMTFSVSGAILTEAALSFIGLGDINTMSWGIMLQLVSQSKALTAWWWLLPPGLAITLISLAFFLVGRAFDEIVNPRLRKR